MGMTSHQLAASLLEEPDVPVYVTDNETGQPGPVTGLLRLEDNLLICTDTAWSGMVYHN
jgi:hypothetical protein